MKKEEGLLYDCAKRRISPYLLRWRKLIIDRQSCQHEHSMPTIVGSRVDPVGNSGVASISDG